MIANKISDSCVLISVPYIGVATVRALTHYSVISRAGFADPVCLQKKVPKKEKVRMSRVDLDVKM